MPRSARVLFKCGNCGAEHRWRPQLAGKRAKCRCGHLMTVPAGAADRPVASKPAADPASKTAEAPPPRAGAAWKWWYFVALGVLFGGYSLYALGNRFQVKDLSNLIVSALAIVVGFWSRPGADSRRR